MLGDILVIIGIFYLSVFIHEIGHCVMPRMVGIKEFNNIYLGIGNELRRFKVGDLSIVINKFLVPFGYVGGKEKTNYDSFNVLQRALVHLGGIIFNLAIAVMAFGVIYYSSYDFLLIGSIASLIPYILKSVVHSSLWVFQNGFEGVGALLNAKTNLGTYFYFYIFGIINSFIFIFNTIPIPMMIKNGKILFNDGGQFIFKGLLNKGTASSKECR
ncbi:M50 family metallopeptidase [Natronincola ferrireducens]|uniref:Peptidase family M50 n=1 Tax=Natronincola ferrireducens TaxID=393762 RepID=A0A1G8ZBS7_9FIRM|nr:M50 family metallopeptidase [Natronincola ferrireducens]SDK12477.1 Peptidase family M50 [Natronincola ferrireducens]